MQCSDIFLHHDLAPCHFWLYPRNRLNIHGRRFESLGARVMHYVSVLNSNTQRRVQIDIFRLAIWLAKMCKRAWGILGFGISTVDEGNSVKIGVVGWCDGPG